MGRPCVRLGARAVISRRLTAGVAGLGMLFLQGCGAGWHRTDLLTPDSVGPRAQFEVWQGDSMQRWHALRVTGDSLSGIPYTRAIDCDSCRTALPRGAVDSIRLGHPVRAFWGTVVLIILTPVALFIGICSVSYCVSEGT